MATVTLTRPIVRGEEIIATVTLREPAAGEMRGLQLFTLMQMDVAALITLIPRISTPPLTGNEVAAMGPSDLALLGMQVASFFGGVAQSASFPTT